MSCKSCIPEIQYTCQNHREENQCVGCNQKNQRLRLCAFGILCLDCIKKSGVEFS